jgi:hypothetical protein
MKRRPCPVVSGILAVTAAGGCTTTAADVIQGRPDGLVRVYSIPSERAWRAARAVLNAAGATTIEERRDESLMLTLTTVGAAGFVLPTRVAVWIEPVDRGTRLTVVSRQERGVLPRALLRGRVSPGVRAPTRRDAEGPARPGHECQGYAKDSSARFRTRDPTRL